MKIILGQGNPGADYTTSRHNIGFMTLDALAKSSGLSFTNKPKFQADIAELSIEGQKVLLVKPNTFYNETGKSTRALVDFYKVSPSDDVLIIHDDLALPFGTLRTRVKGSDAGNNGIKSHSAHIGPDYHRIRVGIHNELSQRIESRRFVLGSFSKKEIDVIDSDVIPLLHRLIKDFCADKLVPSSHKIALDSE